MSFANGGSLIAHIPKISYFTFYTHHMIVVGSYGFLLNVQVSVHPSYFCPSIFSLPDDNLRKCRWIFTKLGLCLDIVEIWLGIANGQILIELSAHYMIVVGYYDFTFIFAVGIVVFVLN